MNSPKIDLSELPDLDMPTGIFGSINNLQTSDQIIILMSYIFEIDPPDNP
jgi:hypothetical protein